MASVTVLCNGSPKFFDGDKRTTLIRFIRKVFPGQLIKLGNGLYLAR
ncbi:MAG: hypothetical protein WC364_12910 [Eubacteriales bacterium]|jgi:hypothetical protein